MRKKIQLYQLEIHELKEKHEELELKYNNSSLNDEKERNLLMTISQLRVSQLQLKNQVRSLQLELKNSPKTTESQTTTLRHTILKQQTERNKLSAQIIDLQQEARTMTLRIKKLEAEKEILQKKLQQHEEKDLLEECSDTETTTTTPEEEIEFLRQKCDDLQDTIRSLHETIQQLKTSSPVQPRACGYCLDPKHMSFGCSKFKTTLDRIAVIEEFNLCKNCLGPHMTKDCWSAKRCLFCSDRHHSSLCDRRPHN